MYKFIEKSRGNGGVSSAPGSWGVKCRPWRPRWLALRSLPGSAPCLRLYRSLRDQQSDNGPTDERRISIRPEGVFRLLSVSSSPPLFSGTAPGTVAGLRDAGLHMISTESATRDTVAVFERIVTRPVSLFNSLLFRDTRFYPLLFAFSRLSGVCIVVRCRRGFWENKLFDLWYSWQVNIRKSVLY